MSAVLVTGAAKRLGAAIARRLAQDGWKLYLHCNRSQDEARALAGELIEAGGKAEVVSADLRDEGATARMCDQLAAAGDWSGLVNSAATFIRDDIADFAYAQAQQQLTTNLVAPIYLARRLKAAIGARAGFAINIADQKVLNPNPDFLSYSVSKFGLASVTGMLAMAMAPQVRVCCVVAGLMLPSGDQTAEQFARVHPLTILKRGTRIEDVADAVAYLAKAENVTGATLAVDAGQHLVGSSRDVMFT